MGLPPAALPLEQTPTQTAAAASKPPARRRVRSLFWPGFAFGFLLLSAITCGVSAAALGLNQLSLNDLRGGTGAVWTPGPVTPVAAPAESDLNAGGAPAAGESGRFAAGQTVRNLTNSRVNIRMSPGYLGKAASDVIGQIGPGELLQILGDPTVADELTWWRIQATSNGQTVVGWVAEATSSGVQILGAAQ
jgi:hypothetical protein